MEKPIKRGCIVVVFREEHAKKIIKAVKKAYGFTDLGYEDRSSKDDPFYAVWWNWEGLPHEWFKRVGDFCEGVAYGLEGFNKRPTWE